MKLGIERMKLEVREDELRLAEMRRVENERGSDTIDALMGGGALPTGALPVQGGAPSK